MIPFAAVLLAGGQSRRMGRDKALLMLPDGRLLWQRQLSILQELGPAELFISGPPREGFPPDVPLLADDKRNLGPLSGIVAALGAMCATRLVVLAVDLPTMTAEFLRALLVGSDSRLAGYGVVPRMSDGSLEPLAAVYPQVALPTAREQLQSEDRSLQTFVRLLIEREQLAAYPVSPDKKSLFINWNHPADLNPQS